MELAGRNRDMDADHIFRSSPCHSLYTLGPVRAVREQAGGRAHTLIVLRRHTAVACENAHQVTVLRCQRTQQKYAHPQTL